MADREKLIELLEAIPHPQRLYPDLFVDSLIAHGVTVQGWIPVTERLPENEENVLILAQRKPFENGRSVPIVTIAFYTDGKHHTEESCYQWTDLEGYVEEADAYMIPEGWWEGVAYSEEFGAVDDFVTHWMPLPQPPKED